MLAAKKASKDDIERMDSYVTELENNSGKDQESAVRNDINFHVALAESVRNPMLEQFSMAIRNSYDKFLVDVSHTKTGAGLHREVLERIKDEDPLGARDAMIALLKHTRRIYLEEHYKRRSHE